MRLKRSIINTVSGMGAQLVVMLFAFISRRIFLETLGLEVLGIHGFLSNIISWLSLADLGIGNAVCYALYKPLEEKNTELLCAFQNFLKKIFLYVAIIYLCVVAALIPFIVYSNKGILSIPVIVGVFSLWAFNQLLVLYIYYDTIILIADQKIYKVKILAIGFSVIMSITQIFILLNLKSYLCYTFVMLFFTAFRMLLQKRVVNKEYFYLKNTDAKLDNSVKQNIFQKTKALVFHGFSDFILNSTDNIVIINILGAGSSGIFTNYQLIFQTLQSFLTQIVTGTVPSVGNYLVTETKEKSYQLFLSISVLSNVLFAICSICGNLLANKFIIIWYGSPLFLDNWSVFFLAINLFIMGLRCGPQIFRNAAALYEKDKFIRFGFAVSNLIFSLMFAKFWGIKGVLIATTLNLIGEELVVLPIFIIKNQLFNRTIKEFYFNMLRSCMAYAISLLLSRIIIERIFINNLLFDFIVCASIGGSITLVIFYLIHVRTMEFQYLGSEIKKRMFHK